MPQPFSTKETHRIARLLWSEPLQLHDSSCGPFCEAACVGSTHGVHILKVFQDVSRERDGKVLLSAEQRADLALHWYNLARAAHSVCQSVQVPSSFRARGERNALVVAAAEGDSFTELLAHDQECLTSLSDGDVRALGPALEWLAVLHEEGSNRCSEVVDQAEEVKQLVCSTQLLPVVAGFPRHVRALVRSFIDYYREDESEVVLGGVEGLRMSEAGPFVLDFEYGHYGQGVLDLACLLRELVISVLVMDKNPGVLITGAWTHYTGARTSVASSALHDLSSHLAIQVMSALHGPAERAWAGRLTRQQRNRIAGWCVARMSGATGDPAAAVAAH